jgi:hypothetical protein
VPARERWTGCATDGETRGVGQRPSVPQDRVAGRRFAWPGRPAVSLWLGAGARCKPVFAVMPRLPH